MSTRTIIETDCDRCDKRNVPVKEIRLVTHRESDPAGGSSMDAGVIFDMCFDCTLSILNKTLKDLSYAEAGCIPKQWGIKKTRSW